MKRFYDNQAYLFKEANLLFHRNVSYSSDKSLNESKSNCLDDMQDINQKKYETQNLLDYFSIRDGYNYNILHINSNLNRVNKNSYDFYKNQYSLGSPNNRKSGTNYKITKKIGQVEDNEKEANSEASSLIGYEFESQRRHYDPNLYQVSNYDLNHNYKYDSQLNQNPFNYSYKFNDNSQSTIYNPQNYYSNKMFSDSRKSLNIGECFCQRSFPDIKNCSNKNHSHSSYNQIITDEEVASNFRRTLERK